MHHEWRVIGITAAVVRGHDDGRIRRLSSGKGDEKRDCNDAEQHVESIHDVAAELVMGARGPKLVWECDGDLDWREGDDSHQTMKIRLRNETKYGNRGVGVRNDDANAAGVIGDLLIISRQPKPHVTHKTNGQDSKENG